MLSINCEVKKKVEVILNLVGEVAAQIIAAKRCTDAETVTIRGTMT